MKVTEEVIRVDGKEVRAKLQRFDSDDLKKLRSIFKTWKVLQKKLDVYGRKSNIPEVVTEGIVAYFLRCPILGKFKDGSGLKQVKYTDAQKALRRKNKKAGRKNKDRPPLPSSSFDCYDPIDQKTIQVKSASINPDLTSFGPESKFQKLYFLDFSSKGKVDGKFVIYDMPAGKVKRRLKKELKKKPGTRRRFSLQETILEGKENKKKYRILSKQLNI